LDFVRFAAPAPGLRSRNCDRPARFLNDAPTQGLAACLCPLEEHAARQKEKKKLSTDHELSPDFLLLSRFGPGLSILRPGFESRFCRLLTHVTVEPSKFLQLLVERSRPQMSGKKRSRKVPMTVCFLVPSLT
jgi:hypothetical protein